MGEFLKHLGFIVMDLFKPETLAILTPLFGGFTYAYRNIKGIIRKNNEEQISTIRTETENYNKQQDDLIQRFNEQQKEDLKYVQAEVKDTKLEVLRIQILTGIEADRLSESELYYFFDKYKGLGGNSFVERRVREYAKQKGMSRL